MIIMQISYYKQNTVSSASFFFVHGGITTMIVGKQMKKTGFIQVAFTNGLGGSQIATGFVSVNQFFNLAHNSYIKVVFSKKYFK